MNRMIDLSDLCSRCMVCARLMHKKTPAKAVIEGTIIMILTDSGLRILQKKARQSVAPSEEFNNLTSTPGDIGNQET